MTLIGYHAPELVFLAYNFRRLAISAPAFLSAATLPIEPCPLLAMRFLPTGFPFALHQASTAHSYQVTAPRYCLPTEKSALPTPPSPPIPREHFTWKRRN